MSLPITALLSHPLVAFARQYIREDVADKPSLGFFSNVLRAVDDDGVNPNKLPEVVAVSRRAIRVAVKHLLAQGLIEEVAGRKLVRLTAKGAKACQSALATIGVLEARWYERYDRDRIDTLRRHLASLIEQFDLAWPHYIVGYGVGDTSLTGGNFRAAQPGPPAIPSHGQDWVAVLRDANEATSELPLYALLSKVLAGLAADYEERGMGNLCVAARFLQLVPDDGISLGEALRLFGVNGSGSSYMERHRIVTVEPGKPRDLDRRVVLTQARGKPRRDAYLPIAQEIEQAWRSRYGATIVDGLRHVLESMTFDEALPDFPDMCGWLSFSSVSA